MGYRQKLLVSFFLMPKFQVLGLSNTKKTCIAGIILSFGVVLDHVC